MKEIIFGNNNDTMTSIRQVKENDYNTLAVFVFCRPIGGPGKSF